MQTLSGQLRNAHVAWSRLRFQKMGLWHASCCSWFSCACFFSYKLFFSDASAAPVLAVIMSSCPPSFRGTNLKHTRDHVPIIQPPPMSKPKSDSAIDISGPRNPDLVSRRNQQTQQSDAEKYRVAFGGGTSKSRLFHTAAQNQLDKERRTHMMQRESQQIHSRHND